MPTSFFAKAQPGKKSVPIKWRDSAWPVRIVIRSAAGRRGPLARWARDTGSATCSREPAAGNCLTIFRIGRLSQAPLSYKNSQSSRAPLGPLPPPIAFLPRSRSDNFFEL